MPHHTSQHARGYSGQPFCCTKGKLRPDEGQGLAAPRPLGGRAGTGKNAGNKSEHLVNTLHVLSPGEPVPTSAAGRLACHWCKEKPKAGKPSPAGAPRPCLPSPPPTLGPHAAVGPMSGSGTLCADPAGSARAPRPKVRFGSPTPRTRRARIRASPQPAGAPPPPPR